MALAEELEKLRGMLKVAEGEAVTAFDVLDELLDHAAHEVENFSAALDGEVQALLSAFGDVTQIDDHAEALQSRVRDLLEEAEQEIAGAASGLSSEYQEHFIEFLENESDQFCADFMHHISEETRQLHEAIEAKLEKAVAEALTYVKAIIDQTSEEIVHEFDKGAEEMTQEVSAFRPLLAQMEAAIQPVINALNQIMGVAHSVGM